MVGRRERDARSVVGLAGLLPTGLPRIGHAAERVRERRRGHALGMDGMTGRRIILASAVVALTLTGARATAEPATARYRLHNGTSDTEPARLVIRHCGIG